MQIEISQGIVEINIPEEYTKIGIKHSGGLDSTIVSYMLALYKRDERPDIELIPITCIPVSYTHLTLPTILLV